MISAGAAGMYCGACIHDNTLAAALQKMGHDAALIPLYTPTRTDEENVSLDRIFYGAINVYLETRWTFFRRVHRWLDRQLDRPALLNWVSRFSGASSAEDLGALTLAVLKGEDGPSAKELDRLVAWLKKDLKPDVVHLQVAMFLGFAPRIREELGVPVFCSLLGEDIFLDDLVEPYQSECHALLRQRARDVEGFVSPSAYYADHMAEYLDVPRERIHLVRLGIQLDGYPAPGARLEADAEGPLVLGYLARICPEKGLHHLVDAFRLLHQDETFAGSWRHRGLRLKVAGYLGAKDRGYFEELQKKVAGWGLSEQVEWIGEVDRQGKIDFLSSLDLASIPSVYHEPKGLSAHGAFPELAELTGGIALVEPGSPEALARELAVLLEDDERRRSLGEAGARAVHESHGAEAMARNTLGVFEGAVDGSAHAAEHLREAAVG